MSHSTSHKIGYVLLVGIGGSNLGAKAVYEALRAPTNVGTMLLCADTIDPVSRERIMAQLNGHEFELIYVSKSGMTIESKHNFEFFKTYTKKITIMSDATTPNLKPVGGRFSVFTSAGIVPLKMLGFNTEAFLKGKADADESAAKKSAQWLYDQLQAGMAVHDMFLFNPELESLGKWYRQLMGESTGKDGKGFFPTVSIGSTDLHSMYQRYMGGPKNFVTTFVKARVPGDETIWAIYEAVKKTYRDKDIPFQEYIMPALNEYEMGKFMQFKMYEIIELARLMGVNPFDQPMVELYKKEVRKLMGS